MGLGIRVISSLQVMQSSVNSLRLRHELPGVCASAGADLDVRTQGSTMLPSWLPAKASSFVSHELSLEAQNRVSRGSVMMKMR